MYLAVQSAFDPQINGEPAFSSNGTEFASTIAGAPPVTVEVAVVASYSHVAVSPEQVAVKLRLTPLTVIVPFGVVVVVVVAAHGKALPALGAEADTFSQPGEVELPNVRPVMLPVPVEAFAIWPANVEIVLVTTRTISPLEFVTTICEFNPTDNAALSGVPVLTCLPWDPAHAVAAWCFASLVQIVDADADDASTIMATAADTATGAVVRKFFIGSPLGSVSDRCPSFPCIPLAPILSKHIEVFDAYHVARAHEPAARDAQAGGM